MKKLFVLLVVAGCGESKPFVITDTLPPSAAWAELSLTISGPGANGDKRNDCLQEARTAGVLLREGAPMAAQLYLSDEGNRLSFGDGRPERALGKWTAKAVCRVAIAWGTRTDERVQTANNQVPGGCQMLGSVEGQDQGYAFFVVQPGSYEAAQAAMQFAALRMGGNFVSVDVVRQIGLITALNGRAFRCEAAAPPPPPPQAPPPPGI
jgi:CubicO group peptidase (beta-lactamase class C family)